jgi:polysaccharide biosynthesis transport protein
MNVVSTETKMSVRTPAPDALTKEMISPLALLVRLIDDRGPVVVHVTSVQHGEGTTTVARELAALAVRSRWCKVALLDAHRPDSDEALASGVAPTGLLETFSETGDAQLVELQVGDAELAVGKVSGAIEFAPKVDSVRALYTWLRANYGLVIVDCPPVKDAGDTAVFASLADATILVVEAERTRIGDIKRARDMLEQWGATNLGAVLNKRRRLIPRLFQFLT